MRARTSDRHNAPLSLERTLDLLLHGAIELHGRVHWSSNATLLVGVRGGDASCLAVYKPARGEQPLWDFAQGTLCRREVAAYTLSHHLGWPSVPPVVLRDGPLGEGSLQVFIEHDPADHYFALRKRPDLDDAFRCVALFDEITNNADRKAGHILLGAQERVWAIDHGLTFHAQAKLRTVIWEYAGQPIAPRRVSELRALYAGLAPGQALRASLSELLSSSELGALRGRIAGAIERATFVSPDHARRSIPYPLI